MSHLAELEKKLIALAEENVALKARVQSLEGALAEVGGEQIVPPEFRLTGKEAAILQCLMGRIEATKEQILDFVYDASFHSTGEIPELKIIDVFICKLRRKLKPFGLTIDTHWGRGYSLALDSKKIRNMNDRARDLAHGLPVRRVA